MFNLLDFVGVQSRIPECVFVGVCGSVVAISFGITGDWPVSAAQC